MSDILVAFLIGAPGAGKDTIMQHLSRHHGSVDCVSASNLLRTYADKMKDTNPEKYHEIMDGIQSGVIYNFDFLVGCILDKIESSQKPCVVIGGYPRSSEQFMSLVDDFAAYTKCVIVLSVSDEASQQRCLARSLCKDCNAVKSTSNALCGFCGSSEEYQRSDDNIEVHKVRLEEFEKNILALHQHDNGLQAQVPIHKVDTDIGIQGTLAQVLKILGIVS